MASIDKRDGKWRIRWRDPDGKARSRQCPNKASAQRLKLEVEEAFAEGRRWEPRDIRPEPDLRDLLKDYADDCSRRLKPNTAIRYARALDIFLRFLDKKYGANAELPISLLTRRLLSEFHRDLDHTGLHGNPRTDATKRKIVEIIQLAWQWLYEEDDSAANVPLPRKLKLRRDPAAMTVAPTWEEMDACIDALTCWQKELAVVLRFTGLRVQQAMSLVWRDIDLDRGRLTIRGELGKSQQEQRGRVMPVSSHLVAHLAPRREKDDDWIVVSNRARGGDRERLARARDVARAWNRAGVREEVWTQRPHHSFRKGFISGLKRAGADPDAVEFLVGHSLGLRGVYIDPEALPLRETVALVPPLGGDTVKDKPVADVTQPVSTPEPGLVFPLSSIFVSDEDLERMRRQPRFDGWDPAYSRPVREITLQGSRWVDSVTGEVLGKPSPLPSNVQPFVRPHRVNDSVPQSSRLKNRRAAQAQFHRPLREGTLDCALAACHPRNACLPWPIRGHEISLRGSLHMLSLK